MRIFTSKKPINTEKLETFLNSNPNTNFFQSLEAFDFFCDVDNYEPFFVISTINETVNGSILAVFIHEGKGPKRYFSRRCIIWGGPIVENDDPQIVLCLLSELGKQTKRKAIYTEFRNFIDFSIYHNIFNSLNYQFHEHLNYIIHIDSLAHALQNLSKSKKRQINKSLNKGAEITEAENLDQVKEFYTILKRLYLHKVKKPLPEFSFFKAFFENNKIGIFLLVKYQKKIIGGIMCPVFRETIFEWFVCGLDHEYDDIYPSVLATWAPIEYAANNGLNYFDFMGAGRPDEDYGVREFKSKFGGRLVEYGRYIKIENAALFIIGKLGLRLTRLIK